VRLGSLHTASTCTFLRQLCGSKTCVRMKSHENLTRARNAGIHEKPPAGIKLCAAKGMIVAVAAFMFALTVGMLTANVAQSGNDRASNPTIGTMALQH
jgi:hypothetical protein